ncbi:MAG: hypothetical protein HY848_04375 [Betaproteobacteria bacterium]|nr:hypothetical protein [Betaproteobacteria bacterium]
MAIILFYGLVLYALCGIIIGVAFVTVGVARVLPHASVTAPARILWLPGAAILWPYVLMRWRQARAAAETRSIL